MFAWACSLHCGSLSETMNIRIPNWTKKLSQALYCCKGGGSSQKEDFYPIQMSIDSYWDPSSPLWDMWSLATCNHVQGGVGQHHVLHGMQSAHSLGPVAGPLLSPPPHPHSPYNAPVWVVSSRHLIQYTFSSLSAPSGLLPQCNRMLLTARVSTLLSALLRCGHITQCFLSTIFQLQGPRTGPADPAMTILSW